jgi:signal transduction histidine kinase
VIIYLEPSSDRNKKALGFDTYTEENRRQALDHARDLGAAVLTAKVVLIQDRDENNRAAFLIYLPIYKDGKIPATIQERKQNLVGYIFSQFDAADFLNVIHSETSSDVAMRIYDTEIKEGNLLAQSEFVESGSFDNRNTESFYSKNSIELAGRKWMIEYVPLSVSTEQLNLKWIPVIFCVGVVFSFILFGLTYAEASIRSRMQNLASELFDLEQQKHELLEKEQRARLMAEQANATKDEFIAVVSHELRTPLNAIAGWTKILDNKDLSEDKKALALLKIEKNLRRQTRLVEELLDFSQILAGRAELEAKPLDFSGVFENAFSEMEPLAHDREIVFVKNNGLNGQQITGDRRKIKIVICNLLSNAIKFTPSGGKIEAEAQERAGNIELAIKDTGSGIRGDFLPFIFDRFRQDDTSSTRFYDGLGLGLTVSEHIVKLHKGSIEAHSEGPGKGSVFIVKIPRK